MPFYSVLVKGKLKGFRFPRRIAIEAGDKYAAFVQAREKCMEGPYQPEYDSIMPITRAAYEKMMSRLLGKSQ